MVENGGAVVRRRTLRRQQRAELLNDTLKDLDIVEAQLRIAQKNKDITLEKAYQNLYDLLYKSYCELVDSEV